MMREGLQAKTWCTSAVVETSSGVTDAEFDVEVLSKVG